MQDGVAGAAVPEVCGLLAVAHRDAGSWKDWPNVGM